MTERINKWAVIEPEPKPVTTNLDAIDITEEALMERALQDFITAFCTHIMVGKTPAQALASLDIWTTWLETVRRHGK